VYPRSAAERHLWLVWGGYLCACVTFGFGTRLATSLAATQMELVLYPGLACLTALAFFSLAANYWGYCAVIGGAYLLLALVMPIDLRFAPLLFGAAWAAVLVVLGVRLRRLARPAAAAAAPQAATIGDAPTRVP
jgi:membrane-associated HD superfamily phosphohydrolase